ncbi:MAG: proliferating cell nuclear antigen (pcna) [bacterium]|nr:proliferating cell nuclear antigen (pcna) [bacterium]
MPFSATLPKATIWKDIISAMAEVLTEGAFLADPTGLFSYGLSPDHTVFVHLHCSSDAFSDYSCDKQYMFGLNLDELKKVMRRAKARDQLRMGIDEQKNRYFVEFIRGGVRRFELAILDPVGLEQAKNLYEQKLSQKSFDCAVRLDAKLVVDALRDAKLVSESVKFKVDEEGFTIEAHGALGEYKTIIKKTDPAMLEFKVSKPVQACYSLELLIDIVKSAKTDVLFEFSENSPVKITYNVEAAALIFFVAPRVEE